MKKILIRFSILLMIVLIIVFLFSVKESKFECIGKLENNNLTSDVTLFMKLKEYRWWVHLWNESDGLVWIEVPGKYLDVFFHLVWMPVRAVLVFLVHLIALWWLLLVLLLLLLLLWKW